jgi:protein gp37
MIKPTKIRTHWPIDWVIVGGDSGSKWREREIDLCWLKNIVAQCRAGNIPVWVKQDFALRPGTQRRIPDEWWIHEFPRQDA